MSFRRLVPQLVLASMASIAWTAESYAQTALPPPPPTELVAVAPAAPPPAAVVLVAPPPPPEPPSTFVSPGGDWKFGFHGIAGASFYVQDTPAFVLNGQGPLLALSKPGYGLT